MLVDDMGDFLSDETSHFYQMHGIPYKRSYLFYGVPGTGKTSMIQALAGKYGRNLCYLSPTHPELTDDSLKTAIERAPRNAIIILEDVDALFGKKREKKIQQSPLTFSGLLNALDGVGNHDGLIFVLTTNFKEELDEALIRDGRVDVRVRFDYCTPQQIEQLFENFYPAAAAAKPANAIDKDASEGTSADDPEIAVLEARLAALRRAKSDGAVGKALPVGADFRDALLVALDGRKVTAAQLQNFFVKNRKCTAVEAIGNIDQIVEALKRREQEEAEKIAGVGEKDGASDKKDGVIAPSENTVAKAGGSSKEVHVHVHGVAIA